MSNYYYQKQQPNKFLKQDLIKVYVSQIRSKMDYAAAGWQPWLKKTNMDLLERVQNKALRIVTGNVQKTRCEAIRLEANTPAYKTLSDRNCLRAREKAVRLDVKHPRKIALDEAVEKRTGKDSWVSRSTELQKTHQIPAMGAKEPLSYFNRPPWDSPANLTIKSSIPLITRKDSNEVKVAATFKEIRDSDPEITIYTDGSATDGTRNGGAGIIITEGDPADPEALETFTIKGAAYTSHLKKNGQP